MTKEKVWENRFYEGIGWTYAECCAALDRGEDPRQMEVPAMLERCERDLNIPEKEEK